MLLRFSVSNHRSICDEQEMSLVASSLKDAMEGLIQTPALSHMRILPAAVVYGANASGKSNLISAIQFLKSTVLYSQPRGTTGERIPRRPFALDSSCSKKPTTMEIDFIVGDVRHQYGVKLSTEEVLEEWLYSFPLNYQRTLFRRVRDEYEFGRSLPGQNKVISNLTRKNSLFLSSASQNDHEALAPIVDFFKSIAIDQKVSVEGIEVANLLRNEQIDSRTIKFLEAIGTGVVDFRKNEEKFPDSVKKMMHTFVNAVRENIPDMDDLDISEAMESRPLLELAHSAATGSKVYFDLNWESAGTRRLLMLLSKVFAALDQGSPLFVDELNASLHTQACEIILGMFSSKRANPKGAQLIATTHDTNLLRSKWLRRDQIWFTEKNKTGATHVFPLTDIRTRKGDNIEVGYLQGRFGAIPFSGSIEAVLEENPVWDEKNKSR